ncbi:MAG: polysulfide reductase NrfD [Chloroflexi bacterium]|nr:polysulfide reductase NrfD [Chloroflexota bacterium]
MRVAQSHHLNQLTHLGAGFYCVSAVLAGLLLWGLYTWGSQQLIYGLGVTALNVPFYWGAYIVNFVFFVGLSAGGIVVASMVHALGLERFRPVSRIAEVLAISCLTLATMFIFFDLGRPDRFLNLLKYARPMSPLIWDVIVITLYMGMALILAYFSTRVDLVRCMEKIPSRSRFYRWLTLGYTDVSPRALARDKIILRVFAVLAIPGAVALHSVTAWIFGLLKATPGWNTAILAPLFVGSALVSGLALVTLTSVLGRQFLKLDIEEKLIRDMGKLLAFLIPVLGYFLFAEWITVMYAQEPARLSLFQELMFGNYATVFWFDLLLGLIIPFVILAVPGTRTVAGVGLASALVVVGVLAERVNLVVAPLMFRFLVPQITFYVPSWVELSVILGTYAVGVLVFVVLAKILPLVEIEEPASRRAGI